MQRQKTYWNCKYIDRPRSPKQDPLTGNFMYDNKTLKRQPYSSAKVGIVVGTPERFQWRYTYKNHRYLTQRGPNGKIIVRTCWKPLISFKCQQIVRCKTRIHYLCHAICILMFQKARCLYRSFVCRTNLMLCIAFTRSLDSTKHQIIVPWGTMIERASKKYIQQPIC